MNFRQKFEDWHRKTYGYVQTPKPGSTAFNTSYHSQPQQRRWEGWQACNTQSFEDGYAKGVADTKKGESECLVVTTTT